MGTQVLRPHDCLNRRIGFSPPEVFNRWRNETPNLLNRNRNRVFNSNPRPNNRKPAVRHDRRRSPSEPAISETPSPETVAILRRGRSEDSLKKLGHDPRSPVGFGSADVLYAGSAFAVSPAPSSLPLPSFSKKPAVGVDDSATRDLRRLLRLD